MEAGDNQFKRNENCIHTCNSKAQQRHQAMASMATHDAGDTMPNSPRDESPSAALISISTNGNEAQRTSKTAINGDRHQLKAPSNLLRVFGETGQDVGQECDR